MTLEPTTLAATVRRYLKNISLDEQTSESKTQIEDDIQSLSTTLIPDYVDVLEKELTAEVLQEALIAAEILLSKYRQFPAAEKAEGLFVKTLNSKDEPSILRALLSLAAMTDIPDQILEEVRQFQHAEFPLNFYAATLLPKEGVDASELLKVIHRHHENKELPTIIRFTAATSLLRTELKVDLAWSIIDSLDVLHAESYQLLLLHSLAGLVYPAKKTEDKIAELLDRMDVSANRIAAWCMCDALSKIWLKSDCIQQFLLRLLAAQETLVVSSAITALEQLRCKLPANSQESLLQLLNNPDIAIRETASVVLRRQINEYSPDSIKIIAQLLTTERDIIVLQNLLAIAMQHGPEAFAYLTSNWKPSVTFRDLPVLLVLGMGGDESILDLCRLVEQYSGSALDQFLNHFLVSARLSSPELIKELKRHLNDGSKETCRVVLSALRNVGPVGVVFVPDVIQIILDREEYFDLAQEVLFSVGELALSYFPASSNETTNRLEKVRLRILNQSKSTASSVFNGFDIEILQRFAVPIRLMKDQKCDSIKSAAITITEELQLDGHYSAHTIVRAVKSVESYLSDKWDRDVLILVKKGRQFTITEEAISVLALAEDYLDSTK